MVLKYFAIFQTKAANRIALLLLPLLDLAILQRCASRFRHFSQIFLGIRR